jgi:predicted HAD superfamily Cof-like phosphohydrolase
MGLFSRFLSREQETPEESIEEAIKRSNFYMEEAIRGSKVGEIFDQDYSSNLEEARKILDRAIKKHRKEASLYLQRAKVNFLHGSNARGYIDIMDCLKIDPENKEAHYFRENMQKVEQAVDNTMNVLHPPTMEKKGDVWEKRNYKGEVIGRGTLQEVNSEYLKKLFNK